MASQTDTWSIVWKDSAKKALSKLGRREQTDILTFIRERLAGSENPRRFGKALKYGLKGQWRYRIGDYRLLCEIQDEKIVILILDVGHRKDIYE